MNIKKEAYEKIIENIQKQVSDIDYKLKRRRADLFWIVNDIKCLKFEKTEIIKLRSIVMKDKEAVK